MIQKLFPGDGAVGAKVSVIVPVLNESQTISSVVEFARRSSLVDEVIVVDDGSIDGTPELARAAGAQVVTSTMLGKGASMEDGLRVANNEALLYLDGDLQGLVPDLIERMARPILENQADFVKSKFTRAAGRVTVLTAKPLLRTYFPELAHFEQPLSGIIAGRRSLLQALRFENDYGVDIGLLIDVALAKARIAEVDIGHIEHDSQSLELLGEMATQVARALLDRATRCGRHRVAYVTEIKEGERLRRAHPEFVLERLPPAEKLALFDMDGVLLNGRFIRELADATGKTTELSEWLDNASVSPGERTRRIARIFAGVPCELFETIARTMPLVPGAVEAVVGLRKLGYRVGVVTDSFQIVAETVRRRVFADFSLANLMRFTRGKASGNITLCPAMIHPQGCQEHEICKVNVLRYIMERTGIGAENVLAVGDGENDVCLLRAVGTSVAFEPKTPAVRAAAQNVIRKTLAQILSLPAMLRAGSDCAAA
ncbi:MAG: glycosyltransferase [Verrucomicrobia subdivision 3 bacterium]|nr:glycosyltransferase [Limisphaerales bacterium]